MVAQVESTPLLKIRKPEIGGRRTPTWPVKKDPHVLAKPTRLVDSPEILEIRVERLLLAFEVGHPDADHESASSRFLLEGWLDDSGMGGQVVRVEHVDESCSVSEPGGLSDRRAGVKLRKEKDLVILISSRVFDARAFWLSSTPQRGEEDE
jgi:hypothetical protein